MTAQPKFRVIANLGDASPLEYGGYFVLVDDTDMYAPEAEWLPPPRDEVGDDADADADDAIWTVYRFILEPCTYDPETGVLSDNEFYPRHAAWFAKPESERASRPQDTTYLSDLVKFSGTSLAELLSGFCSQDPIERAKSWRLVGEYHGFHELDSYPLSLNRLEVIKRYPEFSDCIS